MNISQLLTKLKTLVYSKSEMDTKLSAVVHTSGAEDISGNKNFIDNLTRGGKNVDVIEEQGDGYIRYSNGIQICWGSYSWQSTERTQWGNLYETCLPTRVSYAKSFVEIPSVSFSGNWGVNSAMIDSSSGTKTLIPDVWLCRPDDRGVQICTVRYIAVGRWK